MQTKEVTTHQLMTAAMRDERTYPISTILLAQMQQDMTKLRAKAQHFIAELPLSQTQKFRDETLVELHNQARNLGMPENITLQGFITLLTKWLSEITSELQRLRRVDESCEGSEEDEREDE